VSTVDQSIRIPPATSNAAAAAAAVSGICTTPNTAPHGSLRGSPTIRILPFIVGPGDDIGNESVPKITRNNTTSINFSKTAISTLVISNRNSLRVLFDKIASVYFI